MIKQCILAFFLLLDNMYGSTAQPLEWEIIIPSYNNEQWCIKNIESLIHQTYAFWHATIIVDCSTDATALLLQQYIESHGLKQRFSLIINETNQGALANIYNTAITVPPEKIIGLLDGDDWLKHDHVLEDITAVYQKKNIWMTFGQFEVWPEGRTGHCRPYRKKVIDENHYRAVYGMLPSHFRTFYAWLFQLINKDDLQYEGKFFPVTWDMAIMFPLIEMAGKHHACITDVVYVYNIANPLNDFKEHAQLQADLDRYIRSKKRYMPLPKKPLLSKRML